MQYRTKVIINGAELTDEQKENASSITSVTVTRSCGSGFQIGSTASSMLEFTVIKPYKESFDGDKIDFYIKEEESDEVSKELQLAEEVGDTTATEHVEELTDESELETEETEDPDVEEGDVTEEEEAEEEAEENAQAEALFEMMNGEDATEEEEEPESASEAPGQWTLLGSFYVYKQTNNNDGTVTLQCFDGFQLMNDPYTPSIQQGTFQQFYDDIRTQCQEKGIIVDADTFEEEMNPELEWNQECTLREAIGYLAGLQGGFATFGDDNTLGISFYSYEDSVILRSNLLSSTGTSAGETTVEGIVCTVNLRQDTIEAGDGGGQSLYFYNPFMTQELLDGILEEYQGMRYTGGLFRMSWNPELMPGDLTRVMSDNEYKNYLAMQNALQNSGSMSAAEILNLKKEINAVGTPVLVSTETITFGGEAVAEIRSHLMTETEKANAPLSPSDAKFRVVTADLIKTKELVAEKASITDLEATNANIKNLQAADATINGKVTAAEGEIGNLKTDNADIRKMVAEKASITDLEATNANIKNLQAADATISGRVTAAEADINSVKADYVKASELDAKAATIVQAEIGKATIKDAQIESINGKKIEDSSIVAAALSKEVIQNFQNNNIYYQADAPEGADLKEGDLWYKTLTKTSGDRAGVIFVYDGTEWVNKPFDSESILAGSITAAEIATGTITANEIEAGTITAKEMNMENLQTNIARVGDSEGKHLDILTDGIEIKDGDKTLAKYGDTVVIGDDDGDNIHIDGHGVTIRKSDSVLLNMENDENGIADENINAIVDVATLVYNKEKDEYVAKSTYPLLTKGDQFKPYACFYKSDNLGAGNLELVDISDGIEMPYTADINWDSDHRMELYVTNQNLTKFCKKYGVEKDDVTIMMDYAMRYNGTALTLGKRSSTLSLRGQDNSIAVGWENVAGEESIAIGRFSVAQDNSIACGYDSYATGESIAVGTRAEAMNICSAAIGTEVKVTDENQLVIGKKNATHINGGDDIAFTIGNGTTNDDGEELESNAAVITKSGDIRLHGTVYTGCERDSSGGKSITDLIYPVGSIYMSVNAADPSTLFGGTWERIKDTFLLSAGDTYSAGASGGSPNAIVVSHTHTQAGHKHTPSNGNGYMSYTSGAAERVKVSTSSGTRYAIVGKKSATSADASGLRYSDGTSSATPTINSTGSSGKGANMPPYLAVYMWKRIS